jgi:hypothetical protein
VKINNNRLRGSKGYLTSKELAQTMPIWYNLVDRDTFYEEAVIAMKAAVAGRERDDARKAERDAVHSVLEKYGLIEWTRGGRTLTYCDQGDSRIIEIFEYQTDIGADECEDIGG